MLRVLAPVAGHSLAVRDIPDPVFAQGLLGAGAAILPRAGHQTAVAPVSGVVAKLHPHAYVVNASGTGVLVHLGIDTVHLEGAGFEVLAHEGDLVQAGDRIVAWDPSYVAGTGRSTVSAVVVLDTDPAKVIQPAVDVDVEQGDLLFEVDC